jgi:hypothetical protein
VRVCGRHADVFADSTRAHRRRRWPTVVGVSQLSFFSAESVPPAVADLTGLLAAAGQVVLVPGGARLSVVVEHPWRAHALADMIHEAGLDAEISSTDEGTPLVRTSADPRLVAIAGDWTRGAVKTVPWQWLPGPRELRAWVLAAGTPEADRYLLGLDPHAPDTHGVGADARRDRTHVDRHSRRPSGPADQWPATAIAPGRERWGTARRRRGVLPVAPCLRGRGSTVGLRRHAWSAILSCAEERTGTLPACP